VCVCVCVKPDILHAH